MNVLLLTFCIPHTCLRLKMPFNLFKSKKARKLQAKTITQTEPPRGRKLRRDDTKEGNETVAGAGGVTSGGQNDDISTSNVEQQAFLREVAGPSHATILGGPGTSPVQQTSEPETTASSTTKNFVDGAKSLSVFVRLTSGGLMPLYKVSAEVAAATVIV